jgi:hypothetical protein
MSETFYTSCADVLALCQAQKDNLEELLDPETGFAPRLRQLCEQQCVPRRNPALNSPLIHFPDWRTFERRETRHQRRLKHSEWSAARGLFSKQSCRASSHSSAADPTDPTNQLAFPPALGRPNHRPSLRPAPSYLWTHIPRPPPSPRRRWPRPARSPSSSSCVSGFTIPRLRRHARTRRRAIGASRSTA